MIQNNDYNSWVEGLKTSSINIAGESIFYLMKDLNTL